MKKLIQTLILLSFLPIVAIGQVVHVSGLVTQNNEQAANTLVKVYQFFETSTGSSPDFIAEVSTDETGFYEIDLDGLAINDLISLATIDACPGNGYYVFSISSMEEVFNLDCAAAPPSVDLQIGGTPVSEDLLTWHFINSWAADGATNHWLIENQWYNSLEVTHTFSEPGYYGVRLNAYNANGTADSTAFWFYAGVTATGGSGNCEALFFPVTDSIADGAVYFVNSSLGDNLTYLWDFGDGSTSAEAYPTHTFADDEATYNICLTITGDECDQQYCAEVSGGMDGGSGLIVNGDKPEQNLAKSGSFDFIVLPVYSSATGVDEPYTPLDMTLFPNPSTGNVSLGLDLPASEKGVINITDITGKIVAQKPVSGTGSLNTITLTMDKLADGTYLLQYKGTSISKVKKVILQR